MKICEKCKTENSDTAAVCRHCGDVLPLTSDWAATLKKNSKTVGPQNQAEKVVNQAQSRKDTLQMAAWSPAMSAAGLFLVLASFPVGMPNAGLVMALGGGLSVAALVRASGEGYRGSANHCAIMALLVCALTIFVGLFIFLSKL